MASMAPSAFSSPSLALTCRRSLVSNHKGGSCRCRRVPELRLRRREELCSAWAESPAPKAPCASARRQTADL
eukprot:8140601-Pyramimonas_sp.AAC.1